VFVQRGASTGVSCLEAPSQLASDTPHTVASRRTDLKNNFRATARSQRLTRCDAMGRERTPFSFLSPTQRKGPSSATHFSWQLSMSPLDNFIVYVGSKGAASRPYHGGCEVRDC